MSYHFSDSFVVVRAYVWRLLGFSPWRAVTDPEETGQLGIIQLAIHTCRPVSASTVWRLLGFSPWRAVTDPERNG